MGILTALMLVAATQAAPTAAGTPAFVPKDEQRRIEIDVSRAGKPIDRFFDHSVGADYPGTLIRDDSQAQLKVAVDELGFRYIRFHAIFHDVLGTVRVENGKTVYDWTKIDQLYDGLLAKKIKPFVELGFTPQALKTSENKIFHWNGNTSHPKLDGWSRPGRRRSSRICASATASKRSEAGTSRSGTSPIWRASSRAETRRPISNFMTSRPRRSRRSIPSFGWAVHRRLERHGSRNFSTMPARAALRSISSPPTPTASMAASSTRRGRTTTSCRRTRIRSSATSAACASRSPPRNSPICRCTSRNGARATIRATRSTIPTSARPSS